jgi:tRNA A37 threonylcarbamoyladenosine synthetase subunit TsaC/SUA5/YrdC
LVLDSGGTGAALPSTIVELCDDEWKIVREGAIPVGEIEKVLNSER